MPAAAQPPNVHISDSWHESAVITPQSTVGRSVVHLLLLRARHETRRLRIAILDAEQEEDKMAAATELIAQRDEALALAAAKDVEIEQLKAQLASR